MDIEYAFEPDFYRRHHGDLAHLDDAVARAHFLEWGVLEGRQAAQHGSRATFLDQIAADARVLEIGPYFSPLLSGPNVRYLDILTRDQLVARARADGFDPSRIPAEIHHVGGLDTVDARFDALISSHSIEHHPDLVEHLRHAGRVLAPGGRYYLLIPDKRFCFDHFLPESTIADVLAAHGQRPAVHSLKSVIEHIALTTHNEAPLHWAGDHGARRPTDQDARIDDALGRYAESRGGYIDVHAWYFTPVNFWNIMASLHARGLTRLRPHLVYPTLRNTFEFYAILERDGAMD